MGWDGTVYVCERERVVYTYPGDLIASPLLVVMHEWRWEGD